MKHNEHTELGPCRNCGAKWPRKGKGMPIRCPRCGVQKWQQKVEATQ